MCGRFALTSTVKALESLFKLSEPPVELLPRYNIAPSQLISVAANKADGSRGKLSQIKWGLVPAWSNDPNSGIRPINARSEGIRQKRMFSELIAHKRCLVAASGFYEWQTVGKKKNPFHFRMRDGEPFALAAIWEVWTDGTKKLPTVCLLTTSANAVVGAIHDRMPVIVPRDQIDAWLDFETPAKVIDGMLGPFSADAMEGFAVGTAVSSVKNQGPECLQPA